MTDPLRRRRPRAHDPQAAQAVRAGARRAGRLAAALLTGAGTGAAVVAIALLARGEWRPLLGLDERAVDAGTRLTASSDGLLGVLVGWQWVFAPSRLVVPVVAGCLVYWWRSGKGPRTWWALATILGTWGLSNVIKELVQRARPVIDQPVEHAAGFSFPSGHATNTAAMTAALVILVWPSLRSRAQRVAAVSGAVALTLLTAADRVLLGVHYPSDVAAGMLFGTGTVVTSYLAYRHWSSPADTQEGAQ